LHGQRLIVVHRGVYHRAFHGSRAAFERDRLRDARLVAAGYRVVRVTWRQLTREPIAVAARLGAALAAGVRSSAVPEAGRVVASGCAAFGRVP